MKYENERVKNERCLFKILLVVVLLIVLLVSNGYKDSRLIASAVGGDINGEGTEANPFLIEDAADWDFFAESMTKGTSYEGLIVKLTNDINVKTIAGTRDHPFKGIFNGDGHTMTIDLSGDADVALFCTIDSATIQNLRVEGTVVSEGYCPSTFAGRVVGSSTISNCWSNVSIYSRKESDVDCGALVALVYSGTLCITNCSFTGSINFNNGSFEGGGLVGWTSKQNPPSPQLRNCLFAPSSLTVTPKEMDYAFVSGNVRGILDNCYYNDVAKQSQLKIEESGAIDASNMTENELLAALGSGWTMKDGKVVPDSEGQNSHTDSFSTSTIVFIFVVVALLLLTIIGCIIMAISIKKYHERIEELNAHNRRLHWKCSDLESIIQSEQHKKNPATRDSNTTELHKLHKEVAELQQELHKKEAELKEQSASVTEWQRTAEKWETQYRQTKQTLEQKIKDNEKAEDGSDKRIAELQEECEKLQQMLNIERGVSGSEQSREIERLHQQVQELVTEKLHLTKDAEQETEALRQQISSLQEQLAAKAAPVTPAPVPVTPAPAPIPQEKCRIEEVLDAYLTVMDKAAEQELADRFRETAFVLVDCSVSDVVKVMHSPIIGTDKNKRLLRNQARRSNRVDIAESI